MDNIIEIFTDKIILPPNNMREYIDRDEIFELADDIKKNGLISPITVRPIEFCTQHNKIAVPSCGLDKSCFIVPQYELVAGQRRYLAHQVAGILKIKCIVRKLSDEAALAIMTSENLARVDVNPVDEAKHVSRLMDAYDDDIKKVSGIVKRGEQWVRDRMAIVNMPDYMQELLAQKKLKLGVALILLQISDDNLRRMWTLQAAHEGVSIATAEFWLADFKRRLLPGGELAPDENGNTNFAPPATVMFTCAIDGQRYDVRMLKSILIYEGNLEYFNAFASAFREPPAETES